MQNLLQFFNIIFFKEFYFKQHFYKLYFKYFSRFSNFASNRFNGYYKKKILTSLVTKRILLDLHQHLLQNYYS